MSGTSDAGGPPGAPTVDLGIPGIVETQEIGRGGFAVVYRGMRQGFNQSVAVKVLAAALDNDSRQRFDREIRAMGALFGHPGIVGIITAGFTVADRPYIVMEDMTGGSLADALKQRGPYSWQETVQIGDGLASALEAAHSAHVLHRDVKPENVLFSRYGAAKLSDFGLAAFTEGPETRSIAVMVSVAHTAPEVLDGAPRTAGTDVYGLASTLMTMILGKPPFARGPSETTGAIFKRISTDPPPDLRVLGVPDAVCRVLERALAKTPEQRYATATEFRRDLDLARTGTVPTTTAAVMPAVDDDKTLPWVTPGVEAAAAPVGPQTPAIPLAPPSPPKAPRQRSNGSLSAWIAANTVVAAVIAILIVAVGGTGIYLVASHSGPTPSPSASPSVAPSPSSSPTPAPASSFNPTAALITKNDLGTGNYTNDGHAEALASWACAPADPTTTTATGSANELFTTNFNDDQGTAITLAVANYVYVFRTSADAAAFIQAATTVARHCTANGATLPSPPQSGDSSLRVSYENSSQGDNDLMYVQVKNGVSVIIAASSANQWEFFESSIQSMSDNAADDLQTAQGA